MDRIEPVQPRVAPLIETPAQENLPAKKGGKGLLENARDQRISHTPQEIRSQEAFTIPQRQSEEGDLAIHEFTSVAMRDYRDGFNFEKAIRNFYQAMIAISEKDQEMLAEALENLREETKLIGRERDQAFQEIYQKMSRNKNLEWVQLVATAIGTAAIGTAAGGPLMLLMVGSLLLQVNAVTNNKVEAKLDGFLLSEESWTKLTTILSLGSSVAALYLSPTNLMDLPKLLEKIGNHISLGAQALISYTDYQVAKDTQKKETFALEIDWNHIQLEDLTELLLAAKNRQSEFIKFFRIQFQMRAADQSQIIGALNA